MALRVNFNCILLMFTVVTSGFDLILEATEHAEKAFLRMIRCIRYHMQCTLFVYPKDF